MIKMRIKLKFEPRQRNQKFWDLIKLWISFGSQIKSLIKEISRFRAYSGSNNKQLKFKDHFVNGAKIQGSNYNLPKGLIAKPQGPNANGL